MKEILVSVIIPVYNGERYLAEALDSVLRQSHPADEIIVIDDGSTDGSAKIIESFRASVEYHWQPNGGPGAARNLGVTLAHGAFLAFLDADDLWTEDSSNVNSPPSPVIRRWIWSLGTSINIAVLNWTKKARGESPDHENYQVYTLALC